MKSLFALTAFLLSSIFSFSQVAKIDTITGSIKGEIPFDKEFLLPVDLEKHQTPESLMIYKKRNGKPFPFSYLEKKRAQDIYDPDPTDSTDYVDKYKDKLIINLSGVKIRRDKNKIFLVIPPLAPSTQYEFHLTSSDYSYSLENREKVIKGYSILSSLRATLPINYNAEILTDSINEYIKSADFTRAFGYLAIRDEFKINELDQKNMNEKEKEREESKPYFKRKKIVDSLIDAQKKLPIANLNAFVECYYDSMKAFDWCDTCKMHYHVYANYFDKQDLLYIEKEEFLTAVGSGFLSIKDLPNAKVSDSADFKERLSNLNETYEFVYGFLRYQSYHDGFGCVGKSVLQELEDVIDEIGELRIAWSELLNSLEDELTHDFLIRKVNVGYTNGSITESTKGKFTVRPDFGVVLTGNFEDFSTAMPFVGVRFNFRPLDTDLPYRQISRKGFAHRSSLGVSFSTNSIADGSTRFDLVGRNNLIVDYGFRINNAMCISAGTVVFKRSNPDPLISNQQLAFMPVIGITIDFSIIEAIDNVKTVLTGK
ncbi:MAG: hypothetical protein ACFHU9_02360 [Fluviicola sp.]